jgi:MoxR-like ATPase
MRRGKTMRSIAISLGGQFKRLQCTPDLLPNDVTGVAVFNQQRGEFEFHPGPIFVNVLLADEINRATPRTQSALLEAMQEQQVTVDGVSRSLPRPFMVLATQNPSIQHLPAGSRLIISPDAPGGGSSPTCGGSTARRASHHQLQQVSTKRSCWSSEAGGWAVDGHCRYIVALVTATRTHGDAALGASPRASLALFKTAQALAALRGRDHALPDDVKYLTPFALAHRLIVKPEAELRGQTAWKIVADIVERTPLNLEA